jgi:hypothetical protein
MLRDVFFVISWVLVIAAAVSLLLTGLGLWWMVESRRRRNRFGRHDRIVAPLHWLYSPGEAPRLHRRLLNAVATGRRAATVVDEGRGSPSGLVELANQLEVQAGSVDDGLILASRLSATARLRLIAELRPAVREAEAIAERLVRIAIGSRNGWGQDFLDTTRLHDRLDALEQAHREISELEVALRQTQ